MECFTAVVHTVGGNVGKLPQTVDKWQSYTKRVQSIGEVGMIHAMFDSNTRGPDEHFMTNMRDLILDTAPASVFESLVAVLEPYVARQINKVTTTMATLGDVEGWWQGKLGHKVL